LWALTIGVSEYEDSRINLKYADHDALRIAQMLKTQEGLLFKEVFTHVLVNQEATRGKILRAMSEFLGQASADDVVLIFLAGHGLQDRQTGSYYYIPYNANADNISIEGLPMQMFDEAIKRLRHNVDKLVLWLDTCHAGAMSVAARGVNVGEDLAEALERASGQYVLSASSAGQESLEDESYRFEGETRAHGAFTYSLLNGMRGAAADSAGVIWLSDLFNHVGKEVPRMTRGKQHPRGDIRGTDLPLFVMNKEVLTQLSQPLDESLLISPVAHPTASLPALGSVAPKQGGSKLWLWLLLGGAAAAGGAGVALSGGGGDSGPQTGDVTINVQVP